MATIMRAGCHSNFWGGLIAFLTSLLGTLLLANESARPWAVLILVASAMLAVVLWRRQNWISAFPSDATPLLLHFIRNPNLYLGRGASLLIWSPHIPISFAGFHRASRRGKHLFYTYLLTPPQAQPTQK